MELKFYYNKEKNLCAEDIWIVRYIIYNSDIYDSHDEEKLLKKLEEDGFNHQWEPCYVSDSIYDTLQYHTDNY